MRGLLGRVLAIGADSGDDEDTRLRTVLLVLAALTIAPLAVLWGLLYWLAGAAAAALIPWAYAVVAILGLAMFAVTQRYAWFAGPGEIVIGPETARMLDGAVALRPLGQITVKGRSQPVEAFSIPPPYRPRIEVARR